jgi:hypothetical protein
MKMDLPADEAGEGSILLLVSDQYASNNVLRQNQVAGLHAFRIAVFVMRTRGCGWCNFAMAGHFPGILGIIFCAISTNLNLSCYSHKKAGR